ncbi:MAG: DUF3616 domain-containing protein [Steroidobacteraceae bacterium]
MTSRSTDFKLAVLIGTLLVSAQAGAQAVNFTGMCDASGAIPLSATTFAVADDEDNVLRSYDAIRGGAPLHATDLSKQLGLPESFNKKGVLKPAPETDIEAATLLEGRAYWITSYGRNSKGKEQPARMRFFTTTVPADTHPLQVTAVANERFFNELLSAPTLRAFALNKAAALAPKDRGGLNIEGLSAMPDGRLLIGFRNPIPEGLALLVPLENPQQVMAGEPARFGAALRLDLGGLGVRSITPWRDGYLIAAGHYDSGAASKLYTWNGRNTPKLIDLELGDLNPEAFFISGERILLLSDDGSRMLQGKECKQLKDAQQKYFRGLWVGLAQQ